ncbi:MAG: SMC-Scp complex subunit ScpB [Patescibacteria group bacterium]
MVNQAQLEVLFFHYGEPLPIKKIMKVLNLKEAECEKLLSEWDAALNQAPERGLTLLRKEDKIQLVTKPEFQNISQKLIQEEFKEEISPAAVETLAIVAYLGPLPRATIDYIRGVNSSFILRNLLMRGLIERNFKQEKSNAYHYEVSFDFLKHMGLTRIEELPEYEKYNNFMKNLELKEFA